jgi:hypothetical protein
MSNKVTELRNQRQELQDQISDLEQKISNINDELFVALAHKGATEDTDGGLTTRIVQRYRKIWDESGLQRKVGAVKWNQVTRRVLDPDLLTEAIASGKIRAADISPYLKEEPYGSPHIEVRKAAKREEVDD